jgi:molybdopterin molybdotransferase
VCFYEDVLSGLYKFMGRKDQCGLSAVSAALKLGFTKKPGLTHFVRGRAVIEHGRVAVTVLGRQQSHMMTSFAESNCLIEIPAAAEFLAAGTEVEIHILPGEGIV